MDAIRALAGEAAGTGRRWNDVAILYRKHKHRDAIVARLRDEDIPYTVVGGLSACSRPPRSGTWSRACAPSRTRTTTPPWSG